MNVLKALLLSLHLKVWRWLHPSRSRLPLDLWWRLAPEIPVVAMTPASLDQRAFRARNDDGSETSATWIAAENTDWTQAVDVVKRVRIQLDDTANGGENNVQLRLQYNLNGTGWNDVSDLSSVVRSGGVSQLVNDGDTTAQLSVPTGGTFITPNGGQDDDNGVCGESNQLDFADGTHDYVECEFAYEIVGADVSDADTIELRTVRDGASLDTWSVMPTITVSKAAAGTLDQANFRGRTVDANNAAANAAFDASDPALNTDFTADSDKIIRLRFEVEASGAVTDGYKLQSRVDQAGGTSFGAWTDVGFWEQIQANRDVADDAPLVGGTQLAAVAEGAATTDLISGSAASFVAGEVREASPTGSIALSSEHTELDFAVWIAKLYAVTLDAEGGHNADGSTWQFRVVRDDGTPLDSYTNTPTVTLNHQPTHIGGQHVEGPGRIGPFEDSNGNLYALVEAADVATFPEMMKKPSGGHWAPVDHVNQPNIGDLEAVDIRQVGDTLHIAHNPGDEVHYYTFHMSSHGTNPDTWQLNETVETGYTGSLEQATAIEVDSQNGTVIIFYDNNGDIVYKRRVSGTWDTSNTTLDTGTLNQVVTTKKVQGGGATDQAIVFYEDYTNLDIYVRTIDVQSGTASGRTLVEGDPGDEGTGQEQPVMAAVYYDDSGTDRVMVAYREETNDNMETRIINDPWGTLTVDSPQVVSDAAIHQNAKDSRQNPGTLILVGSTFYAFWSDLSTENLLYSTMDVGGASWAAPTTLITGAVHWIDAELDQAGSEIEIVYLDYDIADFAETSEFGIGNGHIESTTLSVSTAPDDFVGSEFVDDSVGNTNMTINKPTGVQEGDVLVAFLSHEAGAAASWTGPSGWTQLGTVRTQPESNHQSTTWWKVAGASEPSSYTWTTDNSNQWHGGIVAYRNRDQTTPINDHTETADANQVDPSLSVTTTVDNCILVEFFAYEPGAAETYSHLDGMREIHMDRPTALLLGAWDEEVGAAGTFSRQVDYSGSNDDHSGHLIALAPAAGGITQAIGQAIETDTAQPVGVGKTVAVGQAIEVETAQPVSVRKTVAIGQAVESDVAQPLLTAKALLIGQAVELDTAQALGAGKAVAVGQALEGDVAQPVTVGGDQVITVGQAIETDIAQALGVLKAKPIGFAIETDTAQALTPVKQQIIGQAVESDIAQALGAFKTTLIGQAVEVDTAQLVTPVKLQTIGQAIETDTALALATAKTQTIGIAVESDLAQALGTLKTTLIGQAIESDTAQPVTVGGGLVVAIGQATESDIAQALASAKQKTIGQAVELDTAQTLTVVKSAPIGQALEGDIAQPVTHFKTARIGQALETDVAFAVTVVGGLVVVHTVGRTSVDVDPYSTTVDLDPSLTSVDLDPSITHVDIDQDRTTT